MTPGWLGQAAALAGFATMWLELSFSRLLAPYFGTTLIAWGAILGTVILAMSLGSALGGLRAKKLKDPARVFARSFAAAGFATLFLAYLSPWIFAGMQGDMRLTGIALAFLGSILTFQVPVVFLATVLPWALAQLDPDQTPSLAKASGRLYARHTLGSLFGGYLPALLAEVQIPARVGLGGLALLLLAPALSRGSRVAWLGFPLALGLVLLGPLKPLPGMVDSLESPFHLVQVVDDSYFERAKVEGQSMSREGIPARNPDRLRRYLFLNEGFAVHSIYAPEEPDAPFTGSYHDAFGVLPTLLKPGSGRRGLMLGSAAGSIPSQWVELFRDRFEKVDGVELDPGVLEMGRRHFGLDRDLLQGKLELHPIGARRYLLKPVGPYDLVAIDAYRQPYIPFQLTTQEFFQEIQSRLTPEGRVAMNLVVLGKDSELYDRLIATLDSIFEFVWVARLETPNPLQVNCLLLASQVPLPPTPLPHPRADVGARAEDLLKRLRPASAPRAQVLRDDLAPIAWLSQKMFVEATTQALGRELQAQGAP